MVDLVPQRQQRGQLEVLVLHDAGRVTVAFDGDVDMNTADTMRECLSAALRTDGRARLDLSHVSFIDSTGVNLLLTAHRAAGQVKEAIVLVSPSDVVRRVLQLCGAEEFFTIID